MKVPGVWLPYPALHTLCSAHLCLAPCKWLAGSHRAWESDSATYLTQDIEQVTLSLRTPIPYSWNKLVARAIVVYPKFLPSHMLAFHYSWTHQLCDCPASPGARLWASDASNSRKWESESMRGHLCSWWHYCANRGNLTEQLQGERGLGRTLLRGWRGLAPQLPSLGLGEMRELFPGCKASPRRG